MQRSRVLWLSLVLAAAACTASVDELPGEPGFVTGACLDHACFAGAQCLSDLCVEPTQGDTEGDDADDDEGDDDDRASESTTGTTADDGSDDDPTTNDDGGSDDGVDSSSSVTATDTGRGPLPDGESCSEDGECESGHCFVLSILGGVCGECELDGDCDGGGCSLPDPFADPPIASQCNRGALGDGCMTSEACASTLMCAVVIEVPGVLEVSTCSECETDGDCPGASLCAPDIELTGFGGAKLCIAPGTLALGATCDLAGSGDAQCDSGHCAVADIEGLLQIGVCSECEDDGDCGVQTCEPPVVEDNAVSRGQCV